MAPGPASHAHGQREAPAPKASLEPARLSLLSVITSSASQRPRLPRHLRSSGLQARSSHSCVVHTAAHCDQQMFCVNSCINYALKTWSWPDPAPGWVKSEVGGGGTARGKFSPSCRPVSSTVFQGHSCWLRGDPARSWGHMSL